MAGKNAPLLRKKFEEVSGKKALTPKGDLSKAYQDWLLSDSTNCKPHWSATVKKFKEKTHDIDTGKVSAEDALIQSKKDVQLAEMCSVGIGKRISAERTELEEKYGIKF